MKVALWTRRRMATYIGFLIALAILAGATRFARLGAWSFDTDELATLEEEAALFDGHSEGGSESQIARLPRMVPLGYSLQHVGYGLFGRDERGSRTAPALFGIMTILMIFVLVESVLGLETAVAASMLVVLWPDHLFMGQLNRFYIFAMFFAVAALLFGSRVIHRRSTADAIAASVCGVFAMLTHTISVDALFLAIVGLLATSLMSRRRPPTAIIVTYGIVAALVAVIGVVHVMPLARGWNSAEHWGYDTPHAILAAMNTLGWPVVVLSSMGMLLMMARRSEQDIYWLVVLGGWSASVIVLPVLVTYHPLYAFPLAFGAFVPAALFVSRLYDSIVVENKAVAIWCLFLCCSLSLPSTASYYMDGSRHDWRSAASFVREEWRSSDRLASTGVNFVGYYAPECVPAIPLALDQAASKLSLAVGEPGAGRLWVVIQSSRGGMRDDLKSWLHDHCSYSAEFVKKRLDYNENRVEVFRCPGN